MTTITQTTRAWGLRLSPEPQLLEQALAGDPLAFSEVYRRFQPRIYGFCLARLLCADAASDAAQETFVRLLSAEPGSVRSLAPWLFGVARHVCIDIARRESRVDLVEDGGDAVADASASAAEDEALSRDDAKRVVLALRRVGPRYRTALVMREIHGLPIRDIAEALEIKEGAAYTVLSRARDAFGKAYSEVLDLPSACAHAVESIYRRTGSGLSAAESESLEQHLQRCPACRREERRAGDRRRYAALLPLVPAGTHRGMIARALSYFGEQAPTLQTMSTYTPMIEPVVTRTGTAVLLTGSLLAAAAFSGPAILSHSRVVQAESPGRRILFTDDSGRSGAPVSARLGAASMQAVRSLSETTPSPGQGSGGPVLSAHAGPAPDGTWATDGRTGERQGAWTADEPATAPRTENGGTTDAGGGTGPADEQGGTGQGSPQGEAQPGGGSGSGSGSTTTSGTGAGGPQGAQSGPAY